MQHQIIISLSFIFLTTLAEAAPDSRVVAPRHGGFFKSFGQLIGTAIAPVRVRMKKQYLSVVNYGYGENGRVINSIKMQRPNGNQIIRDYYYPSQGKPYHITTVIKPNGQAFKLEKGIKTPLENQRYRKMTRLGALTRAVFSSPLPYMALGTAFGSGLGLAAGGELRWIIPLCSSMGSWIPALGETGGRHMPRRPASEVQQDNHESDGSSNNAAMDWMMNPANPGSPTFQLLHTYHNGTFFGH